MSRLSKALRGIRLGPIVDWAVRLAEKVLGAKMGDLKKKLVAEILALIIKRVREAGVPVPDNTDVLVDELIEQTVDLLNASGELDAISADAPDVAAVNDRKVALAAAATAKQATKGRRGRPPGAKNKPRADVKGVGPVELLEPMFEVEDEDVIDLTEFDLEDESDE